MGIIINFRLWVSTEPKIINALSLTMSYDCRNLRRLKFAQKAPPVRVKKPPPKPKNPPLAYWAENFQKSGILTQNFVQNFSK